MDNPLNTLQDLILHRSEVRWALVKGSSIEEHLKVRLVIHRLCCVF